MKNKFNTKIHAADFYLEEFSVLNQKILWSSILEDRSHPKRTGIWPGINSLQELEDYMNACNGKDSEEYGYLIFKSKTEHIGTIHIFDFDWNSMSCEVGFGLNYVHTGQGWATKALVLIESELSRIGFKKIILHCQVWNSKSCAVADRSGYKKIETFHKNLQNCTGCDECTIKYIKDLD